jgi:hypothetical protein
MDHTAFPRTAGSPVEPFLKCGKMLSKKWRYKNETIGRIEIPGTC